MGREDCDILGGMAPGRADTLHGHAAWDAPHVTATSPRERYGIAARGICMTMGTKRRPYPFAASKAQPFTSALARCVHYVWGGATDAARDGGVLYAPSRLPDKTRMQLDMAHGGL